MDVDSLKELDRDFLSRSPDHVLGPALARLHGQSLRDYYNLVRRWDENLTRIDSCLATTLRVA
jgi:hypothetical protein